MRDEEELSYFLDIDAMARATEYQAGSHRFRKPSGLEPISARQLHDLSRNTDLVRDLFLVLSWKVHEMVVFRPDEERNSRLVETSPLPIPFLDRVQSTLASEVEHEQDGNGVVADQWQHIDEFPLPAEIPD